MWDVVSANPWLIPVCLFLVLATVVWLYERTLSRTKPGDDAHVRLFWLIRIGVRRGLPPGETTPDPAATETSGEAGAVGGADGSDGRFDRD